MMRKFKSSHVIFTGLLLLLVGCLSLASLCGWVLTWCMNAALPIKHVALTAGVASLGLLTLIVQALRTWRYTNRLVYYAQTPLSLKFQAQVVESGLDPHHMVLIQSSLPIAFCFGFLRPRTCVSTGLLEMLPRAQIEAVLWHEEYHRQRFDPLRLLLIEVVRGTLFFLPIVREWHTFFKVTLELEADRYAVEHTNKAALAGALHRILSYGPALTSRSDVAIAGLSVNAVRIAALLGERSPVQQVSARSMVYSSALLLVLCLILMV